MNMYRVTGAVLELHSGKVALSAEQYAIRQHALEETKRRGVYNVVKPVQFKRGELVGVEGDLPKVLAEAVEEASPKASHKASAKAGGKDAGKDDDGDDGKGAGDDGDKAGQ